MERWILHADMDAFYASVEQRDHPEWRGKPVIVGATSPRGVVSAASYEARRYGVHSAMPGFRAHQLCPKGIFVAGDMEKYAAISRQVHRIFLDFTDAVEPLALDEAFLDISGSITLFGSPLDIGRQIKMAVKRETGLIVSIGIAPNKLVAKLACGLSKPDGLLMVTPDDVPKLLSPLPIRKLWGVGPRTEQALVQAGLDTFGKVAHADLPWLRTIVGNRAEELSQRARGWDERPVQSDRPPKSIGEEATFESDVTDPEVVSASLASHAEAVARRARRAGFIGRTITLKVKLARGENRASKQAAGDPPRYPLLSRSRTLPAPTADGSLIFRVALELWARAQVETPVRLFGVSLSNLERSSDAAASKALSGAPGDRSPKQLTLFESTSESQRHKASPPERATPPRGEALGRALDAIESKFGRGAIGRAVRAPQKLTQSDRRKVGEEPDDS